MNRKGTKISFGTLFDYIEIVYIVNVEIFGDFLLLRNWKKNCLLLFTSLVGFFGRSKTVRMNLVWFWVENLCL